MNFSVINLGCKVNRVESDVMTADLLAAGGCETPEAEADLIVVNTCTVTGEAEKKTRKAVHRALRANVYARVVVTGCAVAIDASAFAAMDARVETAGKHELLERFSAQASKEAHMLRLGNEFRTRVGIKVQDGCDHACTYCIVHVARGRAWSRPSDEVVREAVTHARAGAREIVLTGINLGSYTSQGMRLPNLLKRLLYETKTICLPGEMPPRFRISSVEPNDANEALASLLAISQGRVCRHLHLPLQSGSTKVLREMARPYDAERFCALVDRLRAMVPELSLSTDVIVGFPGETEEDFLATLDVVRHCAFSKVHVFPYSKREGTPAAARCDQVSSAVKADRAHRLRSLAEELRMAEWQARVGTIEQVLVEAKGRATTESYFEVAAPVGSIPGRLMAVTLA